MPTAKAKPKGGPVAAITRKIGPLPLWAWFVGALAAYFLYTKVRGGSSSTGASTDLGSGNPTASPAGGAVSGDSGGGTSADNMSSDLLSALLQGQSQSEQGLLDALNAAYAQTQYFAAGYGGYGGAAPGSVAQGGPASNGATINAPATQDAPTNQGSDSLAQPAYSFYPAGSGAATGGDSPLYAYSGGQMIAESPIAGSVFSLSKPASQGYEALGVKASDPITFVPTPMGTPTAPADYTPRPTVGHAVAV